MRCVIKASQTSMHSGGQGDCEGFYVPEREHAPRRVMAGARRRAARSIPERGEVAPPEREEGKGPEGAEAKADICLCRVC